MLKVYGFGTSRWMRVQWALHELDLPYEYEAVNLRAGEQFRPEFLRLNPAHKLPVLVDGEMVLTESAAIVFYLAEKYPEKGLMPADLSARAQVYRWSFFAMTELEQPLWRMSRHRFIYPEDKRLPADIELAKGDFQDMAKVAEQHLAERSYLVGETFSAADCIMAFTLDWADAAGQLADFPALRAYLERCYTRPRAPKRIAAG